MNLWYRFRLWLWVKKVRIGAWLRLGRWYLGGKKGLKPWAGTRHVSDTIEYSSSFRHTTYDEDGTILQDEEGGRVN